jgi:microcompartment protein CcmL/EutN
LIKLDLIEQDIENLKQQYDEIGEDGNVMNSYVLPRPVDEMKKEMKDFIKRGKKEIEEISKKRNKAFDKIKDKNYEHIL